MKRLSCSDPELFLSEKGIFYIKKGDVSLETSDFQEAVARKEIHKRRVDDWGTQAFKSRVKHLWPDYLAFRRAQRDETSKKRKKIRPGTFREIEDQYNLHLSKYFGGLRLIDCNEPNWNKFCKTKNFDLSNTRKVFIGFLGWCKQQGYIRYLPDFKIPQVNRRPRRILKQSEIVAIFAHAKGSLLLFLSMALFMAMRRSEIMLLAWDRVHLDELYLQLLELDTKTGDPRNIPLNKNVAALLVNRLVEQKGMKTKWVFPNARGSARPASLSGLKTAWKTCLKNAGLKGEDITWHDFRATCEYYQHKNKEFTDTQKEKFSGSSIEVQKRIYVHFDADDVRGLEDAVQIPELKRILEAKLDPLGNQRDDKHKSGEHNNVSSRKTQS